MSERDLKNYRPPAFPRAAPLTGRYVTLSPMDPDRDAGPMQAAVDDAVFDFLPYGPFADATGYRDWMDDFGSQPDPVFYAIQPEGADGCRGVASYLRIAPPMGSIEIGHIALSPELQRTRAATEAISLMIRWAFDAGYRRVEWKCNAANAGSMRAAERFGFTYEGTFRQAAIVKGRNRDTAWFSIIDGEWPRVRAAHDAWLDPANFDEAGRQRTRLSVR